MNTFSKAQVAAKIEEAIFEIVEAAAERGDETCGGRSISLHSECLADGSTAILFDASEASRSFLSPNGNGEPSVFLGSVRIDFDSAFGIDEALSSIDDAAVLRFGVIGDECVPGKNRIAFQ
jgi:hypothetical protein